MPYNDAQTATLISTGLISEECATLAGAPAFVFKFGEATGIEPDWRNHASPHMKVSSVKGGSTYKLSLS
jgi:hypothetical protein